MFCFSVVHPWSLGVCSPRALRAHWVFVQPDFDSTCFQNQMCMYIYEYTYHSIRQLLQYFRRQPYCYRSGPIDPQLFITHPRKSDSQTKGLEQSKAGAGPAGSWQCVRKASDRYHFMLVDTRTIRVVMCLKKTHAGA